MKRRLAICALLAGAAWLAGCARFQPAPLSASQSADAFEERSLADPGLRQFLEKNLGRELSPWPPREWDFPMLTLAALYFHPSLEVARADWRVAQAGEITAGQRPNPAVAVTPEFVSNAARGVPAWVATIDFDIPIETAGKRGHRLARARQFSEAARFNIAAAAWKVRSDLRSSLLDYGTARRRETLLQNQQTIQQQLIRRLESRLAAGAVSRTEILPFQVLLNRTVLDLGEARRQAAEARARVATAAGLPLSALAAVELRADFPAATDLTSQELRRQALQSRADVLSALADYAATQSALQLEIAKQYPDVHLGPGYQYDQGDHKWALGLAIELPVLNHNEGPVAEALARRSATAARFTELQARIIGELDRALAGYRAAQEQLARADALLGVVRSQQQSVENQFQAGAADQVDVLNAQLDASTAALTQLEAQVRAQQAVGALEEAVQQPFQMPAHLERAPQSSLPDGVSERGAAACESTHGPPARSSQSVAADVSRRTSCRSEKDAPTNVGGYKDKEQSH